MDVGIIIKLVSLIVMAIGVILVYDARKLSKKWFSFNDQNSSTKLLKIVGFIVAVLGAIVIIINM